MGPTLSWLLFPPPDLWLHAVLITPSGSVAVLVAPSYFSVGYWPRRLETLQYWYYCLASQLRAVLVTPPGFAHFSVGYWFTAPRERRLTLVQSSRLEGLESRHPVALIRTGLDRRRPTSP